MSARGMLVLLVASVALLAGCGKGSTQEGPVADATPQAAWSEDGSMHVVQGDVEREVHGDWIPWLWLPNGDLLMHTPSDSSGMAVYRPSTDEFVVKADDEWGRDKYDGAEHGLDSETGALNAPDVLLRIADGEQPADLDQGPPHFLVDYDYRLNEQARVELPAADDPTRFWRDYDHPVRVDGVTFIAFEDVAVDGGLTDPANTSGGILRVEGDQTATTARAPYVQRVFLSSDAAAVLAVTSGEAPEMGDVVPDRSDKRVLELDPTTGEVARELGAPDVYGDADWTIDRVDRVGPQVAAQITQDCSTGDSECDPRRTWVTEGNGWTEVDGQRGGTWFWQAPGTAVSWGEDGGPIRWTDGSDSRELAGTKATERVVSGALLPPAAVANLASSQFSPQRDPAVP